jgi:hypothetical protein
LLKRNSFYEDTYTKKKINLQMSGIVENFIRRIEKILPVNTGPTIPIPGTNHVDDTWLNSDIYPGELGIHLTTGMLYTSNGTDLIILNREDSITGGMVLLQETSGYNKLTVTSGGWIRDGIEHSWISSGTDFEFPGVSQSALYLVYIFTPSSTIGCEFIGNPSLQELDQWILDYNESEFMGIQDKFFLGFAFVEYSTGLVYPISVAKEDHHFPFRVSPVEFYRQIKSSISIFETGHLYIPGQVIVDYDSNAEYLAKAAFVSDSISISADVTAGNVVLLSGTGASGGGASYSATSLGYGANVYKDTIGSQFRFRSISSSSPVTITENTYDVTIGLSMSGFVTGLTSVGSGSTLYAGATGTIHQLRSLTAGSSKLSITTVGNNVVIDVPAIGTTAQGSMLGSTGPAIYAGMTGDNLAFRRILGGTGMEVIQNTNDLTISTTVKNNNGINLSGGSGLLYYGMSGDNLAFRSLTGGSNVTVTTVGNNVIISSSGGSGTVTGAVNLGATGSTVGQFYSGMSGTNIGLKSVVPGYGIAISTIGNDIKIDTTITSGNQGPQGRQGPSGFQGPQGFRGPQGLQGFQGPSGSNGTNGAQGRQGFRGFQGDFGPQGVEGAPAPILPLTPNESVEIYDSGIGWTILAGQNLLVTFDQTGTTDAIYTITQLSPVGSGTTISSTDAGKYLMSYTVSGFVSDTAIVDCVLYNNTAGTPVPGTHTRMLEMGGDAQVSVTADAIIEYSPGDEYGVMCYVSIVSPGTSITGIASASSLSMIKLEGSKGDIGPQGYQGPQGLIGRQGVQGVQGPLGAQGVQGPGLGSTGTSGSIAKFTNTNSIGNSFMFEGTNGQLIVNNNSRSLITGNTILSVQRAQSQIDLVLGNPGANQPSFIISDNDVDGFEISSKGRFAINSGSSYTRVIEIAGGNVGIGAFGTGGSATNSPPNYKLDVNSAIFVGESNNEIGETGLKINGSSTSDIQWYFEGLLSAYISAGETGMDFYNKTPIIFQIGTKQPLTLSASGINYGSAAATVTGEIVNWGTASVSKGLVYYYSSSGAWQLADASSSATSSGLLAIAGDTGTPYLSGMLVRGNSRFSAISSYAAMGVTGAPLYLSETAGEFTETPPTTTGSVVRIIGYVRSLINYEMYFCPDNTWIQIV